MNVRLWILIPSLALGLTAGMGLLGFSQVGFDALQEPSPLETILATRAKHILIRRGSRDGVPPAPADLRTGIEEGDRLFGTECAACHGLDGHKPTDAGRWMSPRAADLAGPDVRGYSDRELFWIVKHGIRFSGMPAFGQVESDEHIWDLVRYLKTLGVNEAPHALAAVREKVVGRQEPQ